MGQPVPPLPIVVIADDDSLVRVVLKMAVQSRGWVVREAQDFDELDQQTAREGATTCLLDINMPGPDLGSRIEFLQARGVLPVIMSGELEPPPIASTLPFLHKPVDLHELMRVLDEMMSGRAAHSGA